ncbi:erythroblast NAD(P)(+)--arginine ADP-ribosyltransferase-like [Scyliorhinus canicula]|uniref:erythroblast NAD(P)(+)--arginine ADP-ribosyltransferase-like n=1 Tax=Scyliorhinus canicula TaxID=7830 RepID=UPI0018F2B1D5|nr:erythroblast NAD(P)(+)--arginine ADP-ribosyltransferase-like [Scyliorhinus canicula]XP_038656840.1 erythroblast NAD(P)(+)--arginine ADP-ribosyltransferase-like [Scyliorhinus canicula]XP_038656842.1 erythroblast NAD(P)(+)--arginine ADP-ribosyltransferase-like [Scyliorhinus canicula]XP_038656843.1 erythroblast NAD(P)(+)--arginine ADP-ribosyltransferase-like [Scyliorhinus canicula]XP_038656844.1 erythroblast NAD(P)(+)--arginine ADP-ribosyltransferase-like [Scyliorhinus canicula]XP_038656845.1 
MQPMVYIVLLSLLLEKSSTPASKPVARCIKLDMAGNSAAYIFTQTPAADQAAIDFIRKEWAERKDFLQAWENAKNVLKRYVTVPAALRREHLMAIHAYTQESPLYREFNEAVRQYGTSEASYHDNFRFKSFHYLLSIALETLKSDVHNTFRGVPLLFHAREGDAVRLDQFSSTSFDVRVAKAFLKENSTDNTLFEIDTELGVPVSKFSATYFENEVLIPPIEVFEVTKLSHWERNDEISWVSIKLTSKGCQGIAVTVDTSHGEFRVKSQNAPCPEHCRCFIGENFWSLTGEHNDSYILKNMLAT